MQPSLLTFVFEILNFVVLVVLLQRIVYRPLKKGLAARRKELADREASAIKKEGEAKLLVTQNETRAQELAHLREKAFEQAAEEAAAERAHLLTQAREDAAAERARAQRMLEMEREAAQGWIREAAIERSTELAGRLLIELAPEAIDRALIDLLIASIQEKPELFQDEKTAGSTAPEVEMTWAKLPKDADIAKIREVLLRMRPPSAPAPRLSLRDDSSLLEGAVLRIGFHVFDASLAGQLAVLRDRARSLLETQTA